MSMSIINKILNKLKKIYYASSNERFITHLVSGGASVGDRVIFRDPHTTRIDMTRPCLVSIGNDVDINVNFQLLTHDWCAHVFRNKFHDFLNSSGKVSIGNNVYIATNVTILKGVTIGDNCIIGAGSIVNKSIPSNTVAVGVPCRVVSSLEDYYNKCKSRSLEEAKEYVRCFRKRYGRNPETSELWEEFIYFVDKINVNKYPKLPVKGQLSVGYDDWLKNHKAPYSSVDEFLASVD